ncbi:MAG: mechanosensitive ion channel family protein [Candidatus Moraniibacteriota bacterium]
MIAIQGTFFEAVSSWFVLAGYRILIIALVAFGIRRFSHVFIERFVRKVVTADRFSSRDAEKKREDTLIRIIDGTINIAVILLAGLMILQTLGVDIAPLLAAAGIAGLAFGFGGQYLIRDVISGLFIILENQYRVGDVVCFDNTCGLVEDISLRMTSLRDMDGTVHHVPHGEIKTVSNMTKNYSRVNLNIGVAYDSNMEQVIDIVNRVGKDLSEDAKWKDYIITPPQFLRIDDFADSAVIIKILGDTQPIKQWDVTGELRKRLKVAFDREGIEIPFPQRVIHHSKDSERTV